MAKQMVIALIGDERRFMVRAMVSDIEKANVIVNVVSPDLESIARIDHNIHNYLLYIEDDDKKNMLKIFTFLCDWVDTHDVSLYLVGNAPMLEEAENVLTHSRIKGSIVRPLDAKEFARMISGAKRHERARVERKHILVIDDESMMLQTIKSWLETDYRVSVVNSGVSAIGFLAQHKVDLILLDYEMPVTSGPQVFQMLRSESSLSDIPIMFLTGKGDKQSVVQVLSLKPDGYMLKSQPPNEIRQNIKKFFEARAAQSQLKYED